MVEILWRARNALRRAILSKVDLNVELGKNMNLQRLKLILILWEIQQRKNELRREIRKLKSKLLLETPTATE